MPGTMPSSVAELLSWPKFGQGIGFRRMQLLLEPLLTSEWGRRFTTIRVTGSNGKGSVTALVYAILRRLHIPCGRYTSPHLLRFHERIVLGDREVSEDELQQAFAWLGQSMHASRLSSLAEQFGSFELITALCLACFSSAHVTLGVMEAGIGGRYDTMRLLPGSLTALTSVDLEHTELLGKTLELIAYDKLDLCPEGGAVVSVCREPDLWERMEGYCRLRRLTLIDAPRRWRTESVSVAGSESLDGMQVRISHDAGQFVARTPLVGTFQLDNIAVACSLVERWCQQFLPAMTWQTLVEAITGGLREVRWPGRFERISTRPEVYIDVGHTPDACSRLVESVRRFLGHQPILLVTGVSANKAVEDILRILTPIAHGVVCTRAYHKGERVDRISSIVRQLVPAGEVWEAPTITEAATQARQLADSRGMTVLVAGGLFLACEFRTAWEGGDPRQLRFY